MIEAICDVCLKRGQLEVEEICPGMLQRKPPGWFRPGMERQLHPGLLACCLEHAEEICRRYAGYYAVIEFNLENDPRSYALMYVSGPDSLESRGMETPPRRGQVDLHSDPQWSSRWNVANNISEDRVEDARITASSLTILRRVYGRKK